MWDGGVTIRRVGREPRRPTISDVAARAGVSIGTVSHVLTGRRFVAPERRELVNRAVADLGYHPNRIARSLTLEETNTIAMVVPDVANPFFGELMRGVEEVARSAGFCVLFGNSDNEPVEERRYLTEFSERRVDGILLAVAAGNGDTGASGPDLTMPVVALDRVPPDWPFDAVLVDNRHGIEQAVAHLVALGHTQIGLIGGDPAQSTGRERLLGFEEAMLRRGLEPAWKSVGSFSLASGRAQAAELLDRPRSEWPTALIAANDLIALGVLAAAREAGVGVPDELSVCGFDDIAYAAIAVPALTSIRQPVREIGAQAARLLFDRIERRAGPAQTRVVRTELVVRQSTGKPRSGLGSHPGP